MSVATETEEQAGFDDIPELDIDVELDEIGSPRDARNRIAIGRFPCERASLCRRIRQI